MRNFVQGYYAAPMPSICLSPLRQLANKTKTIIGPYFSGSTNSPMNLNFSVKLLIMKSRCVVQNLKIAFNNIFIIAVYFRLEDLFV